MDAAKLLVVAGCLILLSGRAAGLRSGQATSATPEVLASNWRSGFRLLSGRSFRNDGKTNNEKLLPTIKKDNPPPAKSEEKNKERVIPLLSRNGFEPSNDLNQEVPKDNKTLQFEPNSQKEFAKNVVKVKESSSVKQGDPKKQFVMEETPVRGSITPVFGESLSRSILEEATVSESSPVLQKDSLLTKSHIEIENTPNKGSSSPLLAQNPTFPSRSDNQQYNHQLIPGPLFDSKRHLLSEAAVIAKQIKNTLKTPEEAVQTQNYNEDDDKHLIKKATLLTKKLKTILNGRIRNLNLLKPSSPSVNFNISNFTLNNTTKKDSLPTRYLNKENSDSGKYTMGNNLNYPNNQSHDETTHFGQNSFKTNQNKADELTEGLNSWSWNAGSGGRTTKSINTEEEKGGKLPERRDDWNSRPIQWNTSQNSMNNQNPKSKAPVGNGGSWSWNVGPGGRPTEPIHKGPEGEGGMLPERRDDWNARPMQWNTSQNSMNPQNPRSEAPVGDGGSWSWNVGPGGRTTQPLHKGPEGERGMLPERRGDWNSRPMQWNTSQNSMNPRSPRSEAPVGSGGSWSWNVGPGGRPTEPIHKGTEGEGGMSPERRGDWNSRPMQWNTSQNSITQQNPRSEAPVGDGGSWSWNVGPGGRPTEPIHKGPEGEGRMLPEGSGDWNSRPVQWNTSQNSMNQQNPRSEAPVGGGDSWSWNVGPGGRPTESFHKGPEGEGGMSPERRGDWNSRPMQWNTSQNSVTPQQNPRSEAPVGSGGSWSWNVGPGGRPTEPIYKGPEGEGGMLPEGSGDWNSRPMQWNTSQNSVTPEQNPRSEAPVRNGGSWSWNVGPGGRPTEPIYKGPEGEGGMLPERRDDWNSRPMQWNTSQNSMNPQNPRSEAPVGDGGSWSWNVGPGGRPTEPIHKGPEGEGGMLPERKDDWNSRPMQWNTSQNSMNPQNPRSEAPVGSGGSWSWNVGPGGRPTEPIHKGPEGEGGMLPERRGDWNSRPVQWNTSQNSITHQNPRSEAPVGDGGSWSWNVGPGGRPIEPIHKGPEGVGGMLPERRGDWNSGPVQWNTSQNSMNQQNPRSEAPVGSGGSWSWNVGSGGRSTEPIHKGPEGEGGMLPERRGDWNSRPMQWNTSQNSMNQLNPRSEAPVGGGDSWSWNVGPGGRPTESIHKGPEGEGGMLPEGMGDWNSRPVQWNTSQNSMNQQNPRSEAPVGDGGSWSWNVGSEGRPTEAIHNGPEGEGGMLPERRDDWNARPMQWNTSQNSIAPQQNPRSEAPVGDGGSWSWNVGSEGRPTESIHNGPEVEGGMLPERRDDWNARPMQWNTSQNSITPQQNPRSEAAVGDGGSWSWNVGEGGRTTEPLHKGPEGGGGMLPERTGDWNSRPVQWNTSQTSMNQQNPRSEAPVGNGGLWSWNVGPGGRPTEPIHKGPEGEGGMLPEGRDDWNARPMQWNTSQNSMNPQNPRFEAPVGGGDSWRWNVGPGGTTTEPLHEPEGEGAKLPELTGDWNSSPVQWNTSQKSITQQSPRSDAPVGDGGSWSWNVGPGGRTTEPLHKGPEGEGGLLPDGTGDWNSRPVQWNTSQNNNGLLNPSLEASVEGGDNNPERERNMLPETRNNWNIEPTYGNSPQNNIDPHKPITLTPVEGGGSWNSNVRPKELPIELNLNEVEKSELPEFRFEQNIDPMKMNGTYQYKPRSETPVGDNTWNMKVSPEVRTTEPKHKIPEEQKANSPEPREDFNLRPIQLGTSQNSMNQNKSRSVEGSYGWPEWVTTEPYKQPEEERTNLNEPGDDRNMRPGILDTSKNNIDQSKPRSELQDKGGGTWNLSVRPEGRTSEPNHKESEGERRNLPEPVPGDDRNMHFDRLDTSKNYIEQSKPKSEIPVEGGSKWNLNLRPEGLTTEPNHKELEFERRLLPISGDERNTHPDRMDNTNESKPRSEAPDEDASTWNLNVGPELRTTGPKHKESKVQRGVLPKSGDGRNLHSNGMDKWKNKLRSEASDEGSDTWNLNLRPEGRTTEPNHKESEEERGVLPIPGDDKNIRPERLDRSENNIDQIKPRSEAPVKGGDTWNSNFRPEGPTTELHLNDTEKRELPEHRLEENIDPMKMNTSQNSTYQYKPRSEPLVGGDIPWNMNVSPEGRTTEPNHKKPEGQRANLHEPRDFNIRPIQWGMSQNSINQNKSRSEAPVEGGGSWNLNGRPEWVTTEPNFKQPEEERRYSPEPTPGDDRNMRPKLLDTSKNNIDQSKPRSEVQEKGGDAWTSNVRPEGLTAEFNHNEAEKRESPEHRFEQNIESMKMNTSHNSTYQYKPSSETPIGGDISWNTNVSPEGRTTEQKHKKSEEQRSNLSEPREDFNLPPIQWDRSQNSINQNKYRSEAPVEGGGSWNLNGSQEWVTTVPNFTQPEEERRYSPQSKLGDDRNMPPELLDTSTNNIDQSKGRSEVQEKDGGAWNLSVRAEGRTTEPNHKESEEEKRNLPEPIPSDDRNMPLNILDTSENYIDQSKPKSETTVEGAGTWNLNLRSEGLTTEPNHKELEFERRLLPIPGDDKNIRPERLDTSENNIGQSKPRSEKTVEGDGIWNLPVGPEGHTTEANHREPEVERGLLPTPGDDRNIRPDRLVTSENNNSNVRIEGRPTEPNHKRPEVDEGELHMPDFDKNMRLDRWDTSEENIDQSKPKSEDRVRNGDSWSWNVGLEEGTNEPIHKELEGESGKLPEPRNNLNLSPIQWNTPQNSIDHQIPKYKAQTGDDSSWSANIGPGEPTTGPIHTRLAGEGGNLPEQKDDWNLRPMQNSKDQRNPNSEINNGDASPWSWNVGSEERTTEPIYKAQEGERGKIPEPRDDWNLRPTVWNMPQNNIDLRKPNSNSPTKDGVSLSGNIGTGGRTTEPILKGLAGEGGNIPERKDDWNSHPMQNSMDQRNPKLEAPTGDASPWSWIVGSEESTTETIHEVQEGEKGKIPEPRNDWNLRPMVWNMPQNNIDLRKPNSNFPTKHGVSLSGNIGTGARTTEPILTGLVGEGGKLPERKDDWSQNRMNQQTPRSEAPVGGGDSWSWNVGPREHTTQPNHRGLEGELRIMPEPSNDWNLRPMQWNMSQNSMHTQNPRSEAPVRGGGSWSWNFGPGGLTTEPTQRGPEGEGGMIPERRDDWNSSPMQWDRSQNSMNQQNPRSEAPVGDGGSWSWNDGPGGRKTKPILNGPERDGEMLPERWDDWNLRPMHWKTPENSMDQQKPRSEAPLGDGGSWSWNVEPGGRKTEPTHNGPERDGEMLPERWDDWNLRPLHWKTPENSMDQQKPRSEAPVGDGGSWSWNVGPGGRTTEPIHKGTEGEGGMLPERTSDWNLRPVQWNTSQNSMNKQSPRSEAPVGSGGSWSWNVGPGGRTTEPIHKGTEGEGGMIPERRNDWNSRPMQWNTSQNSITQQNPRSEAPVGDGGSWSWNVGPGGRPTEPIHKGPEGEGRMLPEGSGDWNSRPVQWNTSQNSMNQQNPRSEAPVGGGDSWSWNVGPGGRPTESFHKGPEGEGGMSPERRGDWNSRPMQWNTSQNSVTPQQNPRSEAPVGSGGSWSWNVGPGGRTTEPIHKGTEGEGGMIPERRNDWNSPPVQWNTSQNSMNQQNPRSEAPVGGGGSWSWNIRPGGRTTDPLHKGPEEGGMLPERTGDWNLRPMHWKTPENSMDPQKPRSEAQEGGDGSWSWNVWTGGLTTEPIEVERRMLNESRDDWNSRPLQWNTSLNSMDQQNPKYVAPTGDASSWSWNIGPGGRTTQPNHRGLEGDLRSDPSNDRNLRPMQWNTPLNSVDQQKPRSETQVGGGSSWSWNVGPGGHTTEPIPMGPEGEGGKLSEPSDDWNLHPMQWNMPQNSNEHLNPKSEGPTRSGDSWSWNVGNSLVGRATEPNQGEPEGEVGSLPKLRNDWTLRPIEWNTQQSSMEQQHLTPDVPGGGGSWSLNLDPHGSTAEPNYKEAGRDKPDSLSRLWSWFQGWQVSSRPYHNTNKEKLSPKDENIKDMDGGVWFDKWVSVPKDQLVQAPSPVEREVRFRLGGVWVPGADSGGVRLTTLSMESPGGSTELTLRQPELDRLLLTDFGRDLHRYFNRTLAGSVNRLSSSRH